MSVTAKGYANVTKDVENIFIYADTTDGCSFD